MVIKESLDVYGYPSTFGWNITSFLAGGTDLFPKQSAALVQILIDAGAIILGKTNIPPFSSSGTLLASFTPIIIYHAQPKCGYIRTTLPGKSVLDKDAAHDRLRTRCASDLLKLRLDLAGGTGAANASWAGPTLNAINTALKPGASSTGTATSVAAGFAVWGIVRISCALLHWRLGPNSCGLCGGVHLPR